jgi:predicted negative regulator of RcsB-dependent stress response
VDYTTEEQQIQALKEWWSENGTSILVGIVIGIGGFFGYNWWQEQQQVKREQASDTFNSMLAKEAGSDEFVTVANDIKQSFPDSGYALLAALHLAKQHVVKGDFAAAEAQLRYAVEHTAGHDLQPLMKIRLARVLNATQKYDEAQSLLNSIEGAAFEGLKQQVLGDALLAKGDKEGARMAYMAAKEATDSYMAKNELDMMINDLAVAEISASPSVETAAEPQAETSEKTNSEETPATEEGQGS